MVEAAGESFTPRCTSWICQTYLRMSRHAVSLEEAELRIFQIENPNDSENQETT